MIKLQQSVPVTLAMSWHDGDAVVDPGTVTVTITDATGTIIASEAATAGSGADARTYALNGSDLATLTIITVVWSSSEQGDRTEQYEVIGNVYASLGELRGLDSLDDVVKFPAAKLAGAHDWWADLVERWCGVSYVPRYGRYERYRQSFLEVYIKPEPREVQAASIEGTTLNTSSWRLHSSGLLGNHGLGVGQLTIHYTHGFEGPDEELRDAGLTAMRSKLLSNQTGRPSRQTLITNELGTVRLAQPGEKAATGIPEVDRVLNDRIYMPVMVA